MFHTLKNSKIIIFVKLAKSIHANEFHSEPGTQRKIIVK